MEKIKEALHLGHHAKNEAKETKQETGSTRAGLETAKNEGRKAYDSGNPAYAGQTGDRSDYSSTVGTTGVGSTSTSTGDFASRDPTSAGTGGNIHSLAHPDREFREFTANDPVSAPTGGYAAPTEEYPTSRIGAATDLTDRSAMTTGTTGYQSSGLIDATGGPHPTFTGNRLDPHAQEEIPSFHEERIAHQNAGESTREFVRENFDTHHAAPFQGRDAALGTGAGVAGSEGYGASSGLSSGGVGSGLSSGHVGSGLTSGGIGSDAYGTSGQGIGSDPYGTSGQGLSGRGPSA